LEAKFKDEAFASTILLKPTKAPLADENVGDIQDSGSSSSAAAAAAASSPSHTHRERKRERERERVLTHLTHTL
jgi:hypothetical protein